MRGLILSLGTVLLVPMLGATTATVATATSAPMATSSESASQSVSAARSKPRTLQVRVSGVAKGRAKVRLSGPGRTRTLTGSGVVRGLKPGRYRLKAAPTVAGANRAYASQRVKKVTLSKKRGASVRVDYDVKVSKRTHVLNRSDLRSVTATPTGFKIKTTEKVRVGDFLAAGVTKETPEGLLVKITSLNKGVVVARQAKLEEAIPKGSFSATVPGRIGPAPAASGISGGGKSSRGKLRAQSEPADKKLLECEGYAEAGVEATVYGDVPLTFEAGWGDNDPYLSFRADMRAGAWAKAWAKGSASCHVPEQLIFEKKFTPVTVAVGPVPVVLVPKLEAFVGADAEIEASLTATARVDVSGYAKLTAFRDRIVPETGGPTLTKSLEIDPTGSATVFAYGRARLHVEVYGVAGPNATVTMGPEASANINENPWWTAGFRVQAGGGIKVDKCVTIFWQDVCLSLDKQKDDILNQYFPFKDSGGPFGSGTGNAPSETPAPTPGATQPVNASGPRHISSYAVSTELGCELYSEESSHAEFYADSACGTFAVVDGEIFGPDVPLGPATTSFVPVAQTSLGAGTAADPFRLRTVVQLPGTAITLEQTDTWEHRGGEVTTQVRAINTGNSNQSVRLSRGFDCYNSDSDDGFGELDTTQSHVGCLTVGAQPIALRLRSLSPGASFIEDSYGRVWDAIDAGTELPNTCRCSEELDNGVAVSWLAPLPANGTVMRESRLELTQG